MKPLSLDRYMDDIDSGADTRAEVDEQVAQTKECLLRGGFKPKFVAHSPHLRLLQRTAGRWAS